MKSIREWMVEKGMISEDDMTRSMYIKGKGGTLEVDPALKSIAKRFVERVRQMGDYRDKPDSEVAEKIHDAIDAVISGVSGTNVSAGSAFDHMNKNNEKVVPEVQ